MSPGTAQPPGSVVALCPLPPCGRSTACWASGTRRCTMLSWWSICRAPASRGRRSQCLLHNGKGMLSSHNHSFFMRHTIWKKEGVPRLQGPSLGCKPPLSPTHLSSCGTTLWVPPIPGPHAITPTQWDMGSRAPLCPPAPPSPLTSCPTTHLLLEHILTVQAQVVPQLPQHSAERFVGSMPALVWGERCTEVDAEVMALELPGKGGGAHNCWREREKVKRRKH